MLDPAADIARRVWITCAPCGRTTGLYLLASEGRLLFVQCGACFARYWLDTRHGHERPAHINDDLAWPA